MTFLARLALLVLALVMVAPAGVASAQFFDPPEETPFGVAPFGVDNGELSVDVVLGAAKGTGVVEVRTPQSPENETSYELGRSVGDAVGLGRNSSVVDVQEYFTYEEDYAPIVISTDDRLDPVVDGDPMLDLDTAPLATVARNWDFSSLVVSVCNNNLPKSDLTEGIKGREVGDCLEWRFANEELAATDALQIRVVQQPDPSRYWNLFGFFGGAMLAVGVALAALLLALRKKVFRQLNAATIVTILTGTLVSCMSAGTAMIVLAFVQRPFVDLATAMNLTQGGYVLSVIAMGMTAALPVLLPVLVICRARPPHYQVQPATSAYVQAGTASRPGVPSWLATDGEYEPVRPQSPNVPGPAAPKQEAAPSSSGESAPPHNAGTDDPPSWSPPA